MSANERKGKPGRARGVRTESIKIGIDRLAKVRELAQKERRTIRAQLEVMLDLYLA